MLRDHAGQLTLDHPVSDFLNRRNPLTVEYPQLTTTPPDKFYNNTIFHLPTPYNELRWTLGNEEWSGKENAVIATQTTRIKDMDAATYKDLAKLACSCPASRMAVLAQHLQLGSVAFAQIKASGHAMYLLQVLYAAGPCDSNWRRETHEYWSNFEVVKGLWIDGVLKNILDDCEDS